MKLKTALGAFAFIMAGAVVAFVSVALAAYPPPSTETAAGMFVTKCGFSHQRQVDPIVVPGPKGTLSGHLHDFFANRSTDSDSTHSSMVAAGTTCGLLTDTAGYWAPSLVSPSGSIVRPGSLYPMYRNVPVTYGTTTAFPPDFRLIAGGVGTFPNSGWVCSSAPKVRYAAPPDCGTNRLIGILEFPNCWDGASTDSADHRSHVVYFQNNACPESHPVKLPRQSWKLYYPKGSIGSGYRLADGEVLLHGDFWNTWQQAGLEQLVNDCLRAGKTCDRKHG